MKKRTYKITLTTEIESETIDKAKEEITSVLEMLDYKIEDIKTVKGVRTLNQNSAMWKFFNDLANEFNEKGFDMKSFLKESVEIQWTKDSIHQYLWLPLLKVLTGKKSTKEMDSVNDINLVYDNLNRIITERTRGGVITPPFPSMENWEMNENLTRDK